MVLAEWMLANDAIRGRNTIAMLLRQAALRTAVLLRPGAVGKLQAIAAKSPDVDLVANSIVATLECLEILLCTAL